MSGNVNFGTEVNKYLQDQVHKLREGGVQQTIVVDSNDEMTHFVDCDLRVISHNQKFQQLCEQKGTGIDAVGHSLLDIFPFLSDEVINQYRQVITTGLPLKTLEVTVIGGQVQMTETQKFPILEGENVTGVFTIVSNITEQWQTEEALRVSEEKYRVLLDEASDPIFSIGLDGQYLYVNKAFAKGVGKTMEQIVGNKIWDVFPKEEAEKRFAAVSTVFQTGAEKVIEVLVPGPEKSDHYVTTITPVKDSDDSVLSVICTSKNINERKHYEEQLKLQQVFNDTIIQSMPGLFYIFEKSSARFMSRNINWAKATGYSEKDLDKLTALDVVGDRELCAQRMQEVYDKGWSSMENPLLTKSGEQIPYFFSGARFEHEGKTYLVGMGIDITERKKAESAARAHQERFKTFFSSVDDAILVHPLKEEGFAPFIEVNDIACERYGYTREEFLQLTAQDITKKVDVEQHGTRDTRRELLEAGQLVLESTHIKKSGETFPVEINSNIVEQYGQPVILAVVRDITERKQAEEIAMASQKMAGIGRLAAGMAHEINSPLQIITGLSDRLSRNVNAANLEKEAFLEDLDRISKSGWRISHIVRSLLTYARQTAQQTDLHSLNIIITDTLSLTEHQLRSWDNITIVKDLAEDLPQIRCDRNTITQVMINLLENARDAMPYGGEIAIRTRFNQAGRHFLLQISDTGCGIPEESLGRIFEPFFTTKAVDKGTGLGLSIVHGIVEAHGGWIIVESADGEGTTFSVHLPEDPPKAAEPKETGPLNGRYEVP